MGEKILPSPSPSPSTQHMNCLFPCAKFSLGLLCSKYWLLEAKLSSMTPNLTNELMEIKVKNFKIVGDKNAFHYY